MGSEPGRTRRRYGELETDVLAVLWAAERSMTAMQIKDALGGALAYNTVYTVVTRLAAKKLVTRDAHRHGAWRPASDPADQAAQLMTQVLTRGPDRTAVLQRFVSRLSSADEAALRSLLGRDRLPW